MPRLYCSANPAASFDALKPWRGGGSSTSGDPLLDGRMPRLRLEPFELLDEGRALQVEQLCRRPFVAASAFERSLNELELDIGDIRIEVEAGFRQHHGLGQRHGIDAANLGWQVGDVNRPAPG